MGKLNPTLLRYLGSEDIAVLAGVECGMKNHELVAASMAASYAKVQNSGVHKILRELCKHRLLSYERGKKYDGYRLTNLGYDYLALHELTKRNLVASFGNQIGVGKESNIYIVANEEGEELCLKLHRLGRVCFRKVKEKRDYHKHAKSLSWLYLSKVSATKEFCYMTALYDEGFPIPRPITFNRHCVVMELVKGYLLNNIMELKDPEDLYEQLMNIIVRFASVGLIHGDFNEFNIMITEEENPIIIDFPQMMSTEHPDAEMYFDRDVNCIRNIFQKRFGYQSESLPKLSEIERTGCLDAQVRCTGYKAKMARSLSIEKDVENEESSDDENDNETKDKEKYDNKGRDNSNFGIEKWLSNLHLTDSHEQTKCTIESGDDSDDCSLDEWISKNVSRDSHGQTESKNFEDKAASSSSLDTDDNSVFSDSFDNADIRSITSTVTIMPDDVRKRVKKQVLRKKIKDSRRKRLVKGEASATTRSRKQNIDHIKQTKRLFDL